MLVLFLVSSLVLATLAVSGEAAALCAGDVCVNGTGDTHCNALMCYYECVEWRSRVVWGIQCGIPPISLA